MMSFYGVASRRMLINTRYVVYNGCKVGMLYSRYMYGGNEGKINRGIF